MVEVCICIKTQTALSVLYGNGLLLGRFVPKAHLTSSWFGGSSRSLPVSDESPWVIAHGIKICQGSMSTLTPNGNESEMYTR